MKGLSSFLVLTGREVESYFLSPLMYFVLTVFLVLNGFSFYVSVGDMQGNVDAAVRSFLGLSPFFWLNILFIPPILTMRVVAEERRSGTLEGLMTAPVSDLTVILAKYVGALSFFVAMWVPSLLYLLMLKSYGALPDTGVLITSYLGIVLLGGLLIAVGVLASAVSPNQVIAAILGIVFNLIFWYGAPLLSVQMPPGGLRASLEHVSVLFHFQNSFGKGVVDTGIVAVYVVGVSVCLFLAVRAIESRRWN